MKRKYGKKVWRYSKEYTKYKFELSWLKSLTVGICLIFGINIYRVYHIKIFEKMIGRLYVKNIKNTIIELMNMAKNINADDLLRNWQMFTDIFLIIGIVLTLISIVCINSNKYSSEINLVLDLVKFALFVSIFELLELYTILFLCTVFATIILYGDINEILLDIFNWLQKKTNLRYDLKRISLLVGVIAALVTLLQRSWK
ncbi:hypothetical protein NYZ94_00110 (plasmid) [Ligilactobacillus salivarius]|nr:hypothetical protein NYZ94_00110 [Ligilactobacillus salivarius]